MVSLRDQTIKQLRDEIWALTVSRNTQQQRADALDAALTKALAERDRIMGLFTACSRERGELTLERDEARADLEELRVQKATLADVWTHQQIRDADEIGTLVMTVERLTAVLRAVEWSVGDTPTRTGRCPLCLVVYGRPHLPTCRLAAALSGTD